MADATPTIPTLSQVRSASFEHLLQYAARWRGMADKWMAGFTEVRDEAALPGGTVWQGQAADSLQARTAGDVVKIGGPFEVLHTAAGVAERGYHQLTVYRAGVLEAVGDAEQDGFSVSDTYGLTDTQTSHSDAERAERHKIADGHASFIRHRVMSLVAGDRELATKLDAATAGLDGFTFGEEPDDECCGASPVEAVVWSQRRHPCDALYESLSGRCRALSGASAALCWENAAQNYADCLEA